MVKQLSFTFTGCGFSVPLLGPIASGLVHLKRNKGLGGTYTPFFSFTYREHPSLSRLISLSNTPHNQTLTLLECLAPKEVDSSHSSLATLRYTDLGPCSFVFLSFLKKPLMLHADCSPLLRCLPGHYSSEPLWCSWNSGCFVEKKKYAAQKSKGMYSWVHQHFNETLSTSLIFV